MKVHFGARGPQAVQELADFFDEVLSAQGFPTDADLLVYRDEDGVSVYELSDEDAAVLADCSCSSASRLEVFARYGFWPSASCGAGRC